MMQQRMQALWMRTKWSRYSFVAGLLVGVFLGWFFHGVVSFTIRFFVVLLLLVPVIVVLIAWWRIKNRGQEPRVVVTRTVVPRSDAPAEE